MGNEWQTVSSAKDKRKRAEAQDKPSAKAASSGFPFDPDSAAKLDAEWDKRPRDEAQALQNGKARLLGVNRGSISATGGSFVGLEVYKDFTQFLDGAVHEDIDQIDGRFD